MAHRKKNIECTAKYPNICIFHGNEYPLPLGTTTVLTLTLLEECSEIQKTAGIWMCVVRVEDPRSESKRRENFMGPFSESAS